MQASAWLEGDSSADDAGTEMRAIINLALPIESGDRCASISARHERQQSTQLGRQLLNGM